HHFVVAEIEGWFAHQKRHLLRIIAVGCTQLLVFVPLPKATLVEQPGIRSYYRFHIHWFIKVGRFTPYALPQAGQGVQRAYKHMSFMYRCFINQIASVILLYLVLLAHCCLFE